MSVANSETADDAEMECSDGELAHDTDDEDDEDEEEVESFISCP
jgi:hypothetical protein